MAIASILDQSTTAYKPLKDHLMPTYKRERSPTPNHPPFYCNAITRRSTTQVHEDNEEEEREYEEQLNDEDEEQSIDINASPKQSMDTPSPKTLVSHHTKKSSFYSSKTGSNAKTITTY
ncbi:unnamed protein product [Microthlaspi erraticum]|uniref:Uncharacterized protein n=1 Tax=Microthlaspi erraticum TaxID=1685480 RepID=A0A6D2JZC2_9BRAS|nr:unnamed protein product [Microthlaspi erraticum]